MNHLQCHHLSCFLGSIFPSEKGEEGGGYSIYHGSFPVHPGGGGKAVSLFPLFFLYQIIPHSFVFIGIA